VTAERVANDAPEQKSRNWAYTGCPCTVHHIYAQVIAPDGGTVIAAASTLSKDLRKSLKNTGNTKAAAEVGKAIAEQAKSAGVTRVAFDRSGFRYHGRVKALADAARGNGLEF